MTVSPSFYYYCILANWSQPSLGHHKEESFYKGRLEKSNLDGDTGGENLKEQENNNNIFNKINTTIYNNKHNSTSWG